MERQARAITSWGEKRTRQNPDYKYSPRIRNSTCGAPGTRQYQVECHALMTLEQVREVHEAINGGPRCFVSVFAGRIADTGRDPCRYVIRRSKS